MVTKKLISIRVSSKTQSMLLEMASGMEETQSGIISSAIEHYYDDVYSYYLKKMGVETAEELLELRKLKDENILLKQLAKEIIAKRGEQDLLRQKLRMIIEPKSPNAPATPNHQYVARGRSPAWDGNWLVASDQTISAAISSQLNSILT